MTIFGKNWLFLLLYMQKKAKSANTNGLISFECMFGKASGPTVSDDSIEQSSVPPHRFGCVRNHHIYKHLLCPVLPEICSDVLVRSPPLLVFAAGPPCKPQECSLSKVFRLCWQKRLQGPFLSTAKSHTDYSWKTEPTFAVYGVVIDVCSTNIGSKMRTCNQKAPWQRGQRRLLTVHRSL